MVLAATGATVALWLALPRTADAQCGTPPAPPVPPTMQCVDLVLDKSDSPDPITVGNELHYRLDVFNPARYGNPSDSAFTNATGVTITDNLPPSVQFVSATPTPAIGTCSHSAGVVTCTPRVSSFLPPGVIPPGLSAHVDITVIPTQTGVITNTGTVTTSSTEVDPADNTSSVATTVRVAGPPPIPAQQLGKATCKGKPATIVDEAGDGNGVVKGTFERDVIAAFGGKDRIKGGGGPDLICGGPGGDLVQGGRGDDELKGGKGRDALRGGAGDDECNGGAGRDSSSRC
jgi:uncharacterized repeat protein (TIGR01451 family)